MVIVTWLTNIGIAALTFAGLFSCMAIIYALFQFAIWVNDKLHKDWIVPAIFITGLSVLCGTIITIVKLFK